MTDARIWHGGISVGTSACDECGTYADVLFQLGESAPRSNDRGQWACRQCVLDPMRKIVAIDRRGDTLHGARIVRELDARTAITLHLEAKDGTEIPAILPALPAGYRHVLAALDRARRVDAEFATVLTELRTRYERAACFSPKQMLLIQWRLAENGVTHDPTNFAVSTRSEKEIAQIRSFDDWRKKKIAPFLSWEQRARFGF